MTPTWSLCLLAIFKTQVVHSECPSWPADQFRFLFEILGTCFFESVHRVNWRHARKTCDENYGILAKVELYQVKRIMTMSKPRETVCVWVGANDMEEEGTFKWLDGSLFKYSISYDNSFEKILSFKEDCLGYCRVLFDWEKEEWVEMSCDYELKYICQTSSVTKKPPVSSRDLIRQSAKGFQREATMTGKILLAAPNKVIQSRLPSQCIRYCLSAEQNDCLLISFNRKTFQCLIYFSEEALKEGTKEEQDWETWFFL